MLKRKKQEQENQLMNNENVMAKPNETTVTYNLKFNIYLIS